MNNRMIKVETKVEIEIRYTIPICTILAIFTTQQFNNSAIQQFQQLSNFNNLAIPQLSNSANYIQ